MHNLSCENELYLHESEKLFPYQRQRPGELGNGLLLRLRRNRLFDLLGDGGRGLGGRLWYFVFLSLLQR